jgi:hypothetical protein
MINSYNTLYFAWFLIAELIDVHMFKNIKYKKNNLINLETFEK